MDRKVSVSHAIYGDFDKRRLKLSIASIQQQTGVDIEVLVAEQNTSPHFQDLAEKLGVAYTFSEAEIVNGVPQYNPGAIRNQALKLAKNEFIYLNDADIIFPNKNFFSALIALREHTDTPVYNPPMLRLDKKSFDMFYEQAMERGIVPALEQTHNHNKYVLGMSPESDDLVVINRNGSIFTIELEDYDAYKNNSELKGWEPTMWHETVHRGGTFAKKQEILDVGGYATSYHTWGMEDTDIQWKLEQTAGLTQLPKEKWCQVIHLDHSKGYFNPIAMEFNREAFEKRKTQPIDKVLACDKMLYGGKRS